MYPHYLRYNEAISVVILNQEQINLNRAVVPQKRQISVMQTSAAYATGITPGSEHILPS